MKVLVINGPNINLLGVREPEIYGDSSYCQLVSLVQEEAEQLGVWAQFFQSNCEGALVDAVQQAHGVFDGLIINAAAYTHTSIALLDALKAVALPAVEVHISDPAARDEFRKTSYIAPACIATVKGKGLAGYVEALHLLVEKLKTAPGEKA